jgi:TrmH family RNA methyltransferase
METVKTITSVHNSEIKALAKLDTAKERSHQQRFVVEGIRVCQTFIKAGKKPLQLYVTQEQLKAAYDLVPESLITCVSQPIMHKISHTKTPSGFLGIFALPALPEPSLIGAGLVLAQVAEPGNMGTLIRTCAALGYKSVVIVGGADIWSPKVVQATAGTLALVNIFTWSWQELMTHKKNLHLVALVVQGGKKPQELPLTNALLVVGNEAHGIPQQWLADCQEQLTIGMPGGTESLNAAVAGSIALYELYKHHH